MENAMYYLKSFAVALAMASVPIFFAGCKASEAQPSGFLDDPEMMSQNKASPFQRTYWNKQYDKNTYTEVVVAPVNMQYVAAQGYWEKVNLANMKPEKVKQDVADVGEYTRNSFIRAFSDDLNKRFKVVQTAGPNTLILEMAITQLVPSKAALNAVGYVTWIPTAIGAGGAAMNDTPDSGKGYIAIEGRVRDGASGEIIGMFADRENPATAIVDLKSLSWWAPAKATIDEWSKQLVILANRRPGEVVKDAPSFKLLVW